MKWWSSFKLLFCGIFYLVTLKMNEEITLILSSGPWTGSIDRVTDFQIIEIYDYETNGPKEMYLVVIDGVAHKLEIFGNEVAYAKWAAYRKKFGLK